MTSNSYRVRLGEEEGRREAERGTRRGREEDGEKKAEGKGEEEGKEEGRRVFGSAAVVAATAVALLLPPHPSQPTASPLACRLTYGRFGPQSP